MNHVVYVLRSTFCAGLYCPVMGFCGCGGRNII